MTVLLPKTTRSSTEHSNYKYCKVFGDFCIIHDPRGNPDIFKCEVMNISRVWLATRKNLD